MQESTLVVLSELELDALKELVNLGVSNAALSLREMAREEVVLSVPNVEIVTREQAITNLGEQEAKRLVGINQNFDGDIRGRALLIFPEAKSFELVRAIVGGNLSIEDIVELEQEALVETGNVLLNACLSTIANQLGRSLKISLPELIYGGGAAFFAATPSTSDTDRVLFVYINFAIRQRDLQGYIAMLLDMPSMLTLQQLIGEYIERTIGGPAPP
jgi:chemotaxis protein CheC